MALGLAIAMAGCAHRKPASSERADRTEQARLDVQAMTPAATSPAAQVLVVSTPAAQATQSAQANLAGPGQKPAAFTADFSRPLSLNDCIAHALTHNLQALVAAQEKLVQQELEMGKLMSMLPSMIYNVQRSHQDPYTPSSSRSFSSGRTSLEPSVSQDLFKRTEGLTLSWDLLNLATTMLQWQQARHRTDIAAQRLERVKQDVTLEIVRAYMRASVAKDMIAKARALMDGAKERQAMLDAMLQKDLISKNDQLQGRIDMHEIALQMQSYEEEERLGLTKLGELLGTRDAFAIAGHDFSALPEQPRHDVQALEALALRQRPELHEKDLDQQIMSRDRWIAVAQMFPTIKPFLSLHHDANSFLLRNEWSNYGIELSWDLLTIPRYIADMSSARQREHLEQYRRLQVSMAVVTQLRLALIELEDLREKLPVNQAVQAERAELSSLVQRQIRDGRLQESLLVEVDQKYLLARQRFLMNYADAVIAEALVANSVGQRWGQTLQAVASN